jgi:hypothetical protein
MDDQPVESRQAAPEAGLPGFIDRSVQQQIAWRDGDIVISVPLKSRTTWMMNIVHQLRVGGDPDFVDIYAEVPWLELLPDPDVRPEDLVASFDSMRRDCRRAFKTHAGPDVLPVQLPDGGPDVRYVVVVRNPDEAIASVRPFLEAQSDAWLDLWHISRDTYVGPDFETWFSERASGLASGIFGFVAGWWPLRHESNVLMLHFADLKRDHEGTVRGVADFLGFAPTAAQWRMVLEYTSFAWMKAHEDKFEVRTVGPVPMLNSGAMIRKGRVGASAEDGITEANSKTIADGRHVLDDEPSTGATREARSPTRPARTQRRQNCRSALQSAPHNSSESQALLRDRVQPAASLVKRGCGLSAQPEFRHTEAARRAFGGVN